MIPQQVIERNRNWGIPLDLFVLWFKSEDWKRQNSIEDLK